MIDYLETLLILIGWDKVQGSDADIWVLKILIFIDLQIIYKIIYSGLFPYIFVIKSETSIKSFSSSDCLGEITHSHR